MVAESPQLEEFLIARMALKRCSRVVDAHSRRVIGPHVKSKCSMVLSAVATYLTHEAWSCRPLGVRTRFCAVWKLLQRSAGMYSCMTSERLDRSECFTAELTNSLHFAVAWHSPWPNSEHVVASILLGIVNGTAGIHTISSVTSLLSRNWHEIVHCLQHSIS